MRRAGSRPGGRTDPRSPSHNDTAPHRNGATWSLVWKGHLLFLSECDLLKARLLDLQLPLSKMCSRGASRARINSQRRSAGTSLTVERFNQGGSSSELAPSSSWSDGKDGRLSTSSGYIDAASVDQKPCRRSGFSRVPNMLLCCRPLDAIPGAARRYVHT